MPSRRTTGQRLRRSGQAAAGPLERGSPKVDNLIVIGASAGGLGALRVIFETLPLDIPAAIVVILHQGADSLFRVTAALERLTRLPILPVEKDEPLRQGTVFIPRPGMSLSFRPGWIANPVDHPRRGAPTTIDRMFTSAADVYGDRVIGVVLSGLLRDGTAGLRAVHERGGLSIIQDPASAEYPDMPRNALKDLPVTFCLALEDIGLALDLLARRATRLEPGMAVAGQLLRRRVELLVRLRKQSAGNPDSCAFLNEELLALRRDLRSIERLLQSVPPKPRRS